MIKMSVSGTKKTFGVEDGPKQSDFVSAGGGVLGDKLHNLVVDKIQRGQQIKDDMKTNHESMGYYTCSIPFFLFTSQDISKPELITEATICEWDPSRMRGFTLTEPIARYTAMEKNGGWILPEQVAWEWRRLANGMDNRREQAALRILRVNCRNGAETYGRAVTHLERVHAVEGVRDMLADVPKENVTGGTTGLTKEQRADAKVELNTLEEDATELQVREGVETFRAALTGVGVVNEATGKILTKYYEYVKQQFKKVVPISKRKKVEGRERTVLDVPRESNLNEWSDLIKACYIGGNFQAEAKKLVELGNDLGVSDILSGVRVICKELFPRDVTVRCEKCSNRQQINAVDFASCFFGTSWVASRKSGDKATREVFKVFEKIR